MYTAMTERSKREWVPFENWTYAMNEDCVSVFCSMICLKENMLGLDRVPVGEIGNNVKCMGSCRCSFIFYFKKSTCISD